jgi:prepilin-type processing-associated H-X9-DG protein
LAKRVKSASNLRQIGQAIAQYTQDYNGEYPDSFQTILVDEDITSGVFISPLRSETAAAGPTTQAAAAQLTAGNHSSYVYLGKGFSQSTVASNIVVAYEKLLQPNAGTNVLFGDGHVEFVGPVTAGQIDSQAAAGKLPVTLPSSTRIANGYP